MNNYQVLILHFFIFLQIFEQMMKILMIIAKNILINYILYTPFDTDLLLHYLLLGT